MKDAHAMMKSAEQFIEVPYAGKHTLRIGVPSKRFAFASSVLLHILTGATFLSAQTVGPDIELRATTTTGSALEASAAFEQGAAYVAWRDTRSEGSSGGDIYVQKLGPDGQRLWTTNG